jgi:hypothetical protein
MQRNDFKQKSRNSKQLKAPGISASVSEVAAQQQEIRESLLWLTRICSLNLFNSSQSFMEKEKKAAVMTKKSTKKTKQKKELILLLIAKRPRKRRLHLSSQRSCNESWPKHL